METFLELPNTQKGFSQYNKDQRTGLRYYMQRNYYGIIIDSIVA